MDVDEEPGEDEVQSSGDHKHYHKSDRCQENEGSDEELEENVTPADNSDEENKGNTHKLLCRCLARCGNSAETIHLRHTSVKIPRLVDALWRECTRGAGKQPLP